MVYINDQNSNLKEIIENCDYISLGFSSREEVQERLKDAFSLSFTVLDEVDLEENIQDVAEEYLIGDNIPSELRKANWTFSGAMESKVKELANDWYPLAIEMYGGLISTNYAVNFEKQELETIDSLTEELERIPVVVEYCRNPGKTEMSKEFGSYYEQEPEFATATIHCDLSLKSKIMIEVDRINTRIAEADIEAEL